MKIHEARRPVAAGSRRPVDGTGGTGRLFGSHVSDAARPAVGPLPGAPLAALQSVLAVQEVEDEAAARRSRAVTRGRALLDELDGLKLAMVEGWLSEATLRRLAALIDEARPPAGDPALDTLLDEIEARAAVEAAKLEADES